MKLKITGIITLVLGIFTIIQIFIIKEVLPQIAAILYYSTGSGRSYSPERYEMPFVVPIIGGVILLIIGAIIIFKSKKD